MSLHRDVSADLARRAIQAGCKPAFGSDAHGPEHFDFLRLGSLPHGASGRSVRPWWAHTSPDSDETQDSRWIPSLGYARGAASSGIDPAASHAVG